MLATFRQVLNAGWVSSAIGLVSLAVALIIYRASIIRARPVYQRRGLRLIGGNDKALPDEVEIRFRGQVVERLGKVYIVFWNSGTALLRGSDIIDNDPLRCECAKGSRILEARAVKITRPTTKFAVKLNPTVPHSAIITFDYLDPGDGAIIELLHTAAERYPEIKGTIRGVPKGCLDWGRIGRSRIKELPFPFSHRQVIYWVLMVFGFIAVGAGAFGPDLILDKIHRADQATESLATFRKVLIVAGMIYMLPPLLLFWLTRRRFPGALRAQELEE